MEGRGPRNRNPSSSASFSQPRGQKLPSNATHQSKVSTFAQRDRNASSSSTSHSNNRQHHADADADSNSGPLVGTCPYMCPGNLMVIK